MTTTNQEVNKVDVVVNPNEIASNGKRKPITYKIPNKTLKIWMMFAKTPEEKKVYASMMSNYIPKKVKPVKAKQTVNASSNTRNKTKNNKV